jgi:hypothetical protein
MLNSPTVNKFLLDFRRSSMLDFRIAMQILPFILAHMKYLKAFCPPLILALSALLAGNLPAQEAKAPASAHHALWKVQGKQATVYLLG